MNNIDYKKWIVNFTKSIAYSTKEVLVDQVPNASGIVSDVKSAIDMASMNAKDAVSNVSSGIDIKDLKNSKPYKETMNVVKSAIRDVQTGDFAHLTMDEDEFGSDFGIDMGFDLEETTEDDEGNPIQKASVTNDAKLSATATISASNREIMALSQMSGQLRTSYSKNTKALANAVFQSTNVAANMLHNDITATNQRLDVLNQNIVNIVKFNSSQSKANEAALKHYARMEEAIGMMMNLYYRGDNTSGVKKTASISRASSGGYKKRKGQAMEDLINYGFSTSAFGDMIKENMKEQGVDSIAELIKNTIGLGSDMMGMGMKSSDLFNLSMPMQAVIKKLLPKRTMKAIGNLDKKIPRMLNVGLGAIGEKAGTASPLSTIAEILGIKFNKKQTLDLGAYEKGAMSWSGTSKKALEEVIPGYLASIEKTLKDIQDPYTKHEERFYNYDKGVYRATSQIRKDFQNTLTKKRQSYYSDSKSVFDQMNSKSDGSKFLSDGQIRAMNDEIQKIIDDAVYNNKSQAISQKKIIAAIRKHSKGYFSESEISDLAITYISDINKEKVAIQRELDKALHSADGSTIRQVYANEQQRGYNKIRRQVYNSKTKRMEEVVEEGHDIYGRVDLKDKDLQGNIYGLSDIEKESKSKAAAIKQQKEDIKKNAKAKVKAFSTKVNGSSGIGQIADFLTDAKNKYDAYAGIVGPEVDQQIAAYINAATNYLQNNVATGNINVSGIKNDIRRNGIGNTVKSTASNVKKNAKSRAKGTLRNFEYRQTYITTDDFSTALSKWQSPEKDKYPKRLFKSDYTIVENRNFDNPRFVSAELNQMSYYPGWPITITANDIDPVTFDIRKTVKLVTRDDVMDFNDTGKTTGHGSFKKFRYSASIGRGDRKVNTNKAKTGGIHKPKDENKEAPKEDASKKFTFEDAMKKLNDTWTALANKAGGKDKVVKDLKGAAKGAVTGSIAGIFLPGGPIGGAIIGAAAGILHARVDFKKLLFGDKIVNEYGDVIGVKKTGLIDQWKNTFQTAFIDNMREEKDATKDYLAEYFKNKVEPEIDYFMKDRSSKFKAALDTAGDVVSKTINTILHPIQAFNDAMNRLANKVLTAGTKLAGVALRAGGKLLMEGIAAPFKIGSHIKDTLAYGKGNVIKGDISNAIHGKVTGIKYGFGKLTGKISDKTSYADYRKQSGAAGIKFTKDGKIDNSDIESERDQKLAALENDEELNALKESDPNKYKRILTERQNNINAQFDKKARGREYRQNAWDKKTKQGVLHKEEKAKIKKDRKAQAQYNKLINKFNRKDAGKFVELDEEEASKRYEAIKAHISDQPEDIRKAFEMVDPKNAADIENFINNRKSFVKMKTAEKAADEAKGNEEKYRASVTNGLASVSTLIAQGLNYISGGVLHPEVNTADNTVKNTNQMTEEQATTAKATVDAKVSEKIAGTDKKDPEGYKASVTDSNDADKPLVDENGKSIEENKDDGEKKEKKSLFASIKDFLHSIATFDLKGFLTGLWTGVKSIGKDIGTIVTKVGGIAATVGVGAVTAVGAAGLVGNGMTALNAIGIGADQDTKTNEALGNQDKDGTRTAYVDKDGNLAKAGSRGATKQIIRNNAMAENGFKSTARLVTGTSNTAKVVKAGASFIQKKVTSSDLWITLVCMIGDAVDKLKNNKTFQKIAGKAGDSVIGKITKWLAGLKNLPIAEGAKAKLGQWGAKYAAVIGTKAFKVAAFAVTATWDLISGMCDAANLFQVNSDDVDGLMKGISVAMKLIADFCPLADAFVFFIEIADELTGSNTLCNMATMMYNAIWDFTSKNSGKENTLAQHQQELEDEVDAYNEANGTNISVKAYNDQKNRTLGGKFLDFITGNTRNKSLEKNTVDTTKAYVNKNAAGNSGVGLATSSGAMASAVGKGTKTVGHGSMVSQYDSDISNLSMGDGYNVASGGCGVATMANMLGMSGKSAYNASAGHRTQGGMTSKDMMDTVRSVTGSSTELKNMDSMNSALDSGKNVAVLGNVGHGGKNAHWINVTGKNADGTYNWQDPETGEVSGYLDPNQIDSAVVGRASTDRLDARVQKNSSKYKASIGKQRGSTDRLDARVQKNSTKWKNAQNRATNIGSNKASTSGATTKLKDNGTTIQNGSYYFAQNGQSWSNQSLSGYDSSVNNTGCVMTSAAMGVSDLLGKPIDPGTFNSTYGNGNTHSTNFSALGIDVQRLPPNATSASTTDPSTVADQLTAALKAGKPVMLYGTNAPGKVFHDGYSNYGDHCVLATGIDDQGNIIVNNPYSGGQEKYKDTHWSLSSLNGLHWIQIMSKDGKGASGKGIVPSAGATIASGTTNASSYAAASGNGSASNGLATASGAMASAAVPSGVAGLADNGSTIQHGTYYFAQNGQRWSNDKISGINAKIGTAGCVLTSASMGASGLVGQPIDPGTFNKKYGNGNTSMGTKFSSLGIDVTRYPSGGAMGVDADPSPYLDTIKNALANRMPVMLYGKKTASNIYMDGKAGSAHCVIATGLDENGNVIINNPISSAQKSYAQKTYPLTASTLQPFYWAQVMSKDGKGIDGTSGFAAPDSASGTDGTTGAASTGIGDTIKNGLSNLGSMFGNLGMSMLNNLFKSGGNGQAMLDMTANDASWQKSDDSSDGATEGAAADTSGHMRMPTLQQSAHRKNFVSEKTIGHGSSGSMEGIPSQLDTITSLLTTIAKNTSTSGHGSYHNGDFGGGHIGHGSNNSLVMTKKTQSQKEKEAQAAANLLKSKAGSNSNKNSTSNRLRANHEKIASGYRSTVS